MKKAIDSILSMLMIVLAICGVIIGSLVFVSLMALCSPILLGSFLWNLFNKEYLEE